MNDVAKNQYRRQRSIYEVHYNLKRQEEERAQPCPWRASKMEIQAYGSQVAGHQKSDGTKYIGLLQSNSGTILKPILKESQRREIDFYERLINTDNEDLLVLRSFVPKYRGCKKFTFNGHENEYIILDDMTENMLEPCIMDVKIGRRTWDPLATEEKIRLEKSKYVRCREEYAFCIPGYQVHKISTGKLLKYGKDHGKKLHGKAVKDAISNFLNIGEWGVCRALLVQLLSQLWRVQRWAERQTAVTLYAASLLLVYDAARVRNCCAELPPFKAKCAKPEPKARPRSVPTTPKADHPRPPAVLRTPSTPSTPSTPCISPNTLPISPRISPTIIQNHSPKNNYDETVCKMKLDYKAVLEGMSREKGGEVWGSVAVIDFAHAFFTDPQEAEVDYNFREGVASFVNVLEQLLRES